jgi:DNA-binding NtrC family response regulator
MKPTTTTTETDVAAAARPTAAVHEPVLTVVYHRTERLLGERRPLRDGQRLELGRHAEWLGPGVLDDALVSRRHVAIERRGLSCVVRDLGSHNGTFVNGVRVETAELGLGDLLTVGGVVLLYHEGPPFYVPPRHATLAGVGHALGELVQQIEVAARRADLTVLVVGETGVGKEVVARALHDASGAAGAFVAVNCGAVAGGVVHSELFGHERGAFTGATERRSGLVHQAQGGTLFLDEIGDATPELQVSLLRLLEQREYRAVGSDRSVVTDARFVAASHVDLADAVARGRFREDLHARIRRFVVEVPPLRARREDVIPLALALGRRHAGRDIGIDRALAVALLRHPWPRNVRELDAVMLQLVTLQPNADVLGPSDRVLAELDASSLPEATDEGAPPTADEAALGHPTGSRTPAPDAPPGPPRMRGRPPSAAQLRARFVAHGGNVKALAAELGVGRTTLYRWFKKLGLDPDSVRDAGGGGDDGPPC